MTTEQKARRPGQYREEDRGGFKQYILTIGSLGHSITMTDTHLGAIVTVCQGSKTIEQHGTARGQILSREAATAIFEACCDALDATYKILRGEA